MLELGKRANNFRYGEMFRSEYQGALAGIYAESSHWLQKSFHN